MMFFWRAFPALIAGTVLLFLLLPFVVWIIRLLFFRLALNLLFWLACIHLYWHLWISRFRFWFDRQRHRFRFWLQRRHIYKSERQAIAFLRRNQALQRYSMKILSQEEVQALREEENNT